MTTPNVVGTIAVASAGLALIVSDRSPLSTASGFALTAFAATHRAIPALAPQFTRVGLSGKDLAKPDRPVIPECVGAVPVAIYMCTMVLFIPFMFYKYLVVATSGGGHRDAAVTSTTSPGHLFPHDKLAEYLSALLCLMSMFMLGIADDLFDIRWRNKFFFPAAAVLPLLVVYYVDFGVTHIMLPQFLGLGESVDLGAWYYVYMAGVAIFCPNSINILAGINGLETGQAFVIGGLILANDLLYLVAGVEGPAADPHLLSVYLLLPYMAVTASLLWYNWYPARVFVGDTFCYFSGILFAVVGILGHFAKTLLLFFVPQVFNFVYSVPQIVGLIECPRHRLPKLDPATGLMNPSRASLARSKRIVVRVLEALECFRLVKVYRDDKGVPVECNNLTLINLVLINVGPVREDVLTAMLLALQFASGVVGLVARHTLARLVFGRDNF